MGNGGGIMAGFAGIGPGFLFIPLLLSQSLSPLEATQTAVYMAVFSQSASSIVFAV